MTRDNNELISWLHQMGLRFNPFTHLESSADAYLLRYLVVYPELSPVWQDVSALVMAPIGGGKTALRLYAVWNGLRGIFSFFPISYVLQRESDHLPLADFQTHGAELARAVARQVFLLIAALPHIFLELSARDRSTLVDLLAAMTAEYAIMLAFLATNEWGRLIDLLSEPALQKSFAKPRSKDIRATYKILAQATPGDNNDPLILIRRVIDFLMEKFPYGAVHFLLDGVDGFSETVARPILGAQWLETWMEGFFTFFPTDSVRLKVFTPPEMAPQWKGDQILPFLERTEILWNRANLVEMLRRRVYIASDRKFETLDALCDDSINEMEDILVDVLFEKGTPLPRELLALMQSILRAHMLRAPNTPYLTQADIEMGLQRFQPVMV